MEIHWSALVGGFLGGSLSAILVEFFRRRARKERYAEKFFEQKLAAYRNITEALLLVTPSSDLTMLRSRMGAGLPLLREDVREGLWFFLYLFDGTLTLRELSQNEHSSTWRKLGQYLLELHSDIGLVHPRRQALLVVEEIAKLMREDLGALLVEKIEATILQKPPDPPPRL